jgi:hypothetical protein
MKRYIAQFVSAGFPEQYAVVDTIEGVRVGEPKEYHAANDEAQARNEGSWGQPVDFATAAAWLQGLPGAP